MKFSVQNAKDFFAFLIKQGNFVFVELPPTILFVFHYVWVKNTDGGQRLFAIALNINAAACLRKKDKISERQMRK